jgi:hypothetical protein
MSIRRAAPVAACIKLIARNLRLLRIKILQILPAALLALAGVFVALLGSTYRIGSLTAMGPGFVPVVLGICLVLLAVGLFVGELGGMPETEPGFPLRPVLWVGGGILAWVLLIEAAGFFPASIVQLLFSSLALQKPNWRAITLLALGMTLVSYIVFVMLLGVPVPAFGS